MLQPNPAVGYGEMASVKLVTFVSSESRGLGGEPMI